MILGSVIGEWMENGRMDGHFVGILHSGDELGGILHFSRSLLGRQSAFGFQLQ